MSLARPCVSLLLGLAALAAAGTASGQPPPDPPPEGPAPKPPAPEGSATAKPPEGSATAKPPVAPAPRPAPLLPVALDREQRAKQEAMALHDQAWSLYEEGRYRAAIERLQAALRIDPFGRELVYNLATLQEKLGDLKDAAASYRRYIEMETDPRARAKAQIILRRLEGAEKEVGPRAAPSAPAPPRALPFATPPRPVRPWVVATAGLAGASFLVGSVFGIRALEKNPGADARTGSGVTIADLQDAARVAHGEAVVADVSFLVSAAAAGTAMFLYFFTPRRSPLAPAVGARVAAPGRWQGTF